MPLHRCPHCNQVVVSRKFPSCTSCGAELPSDWVMTEQQKEEVNKINEHNAAHHEASMKYHALMSAQRHPKRI